MNPYHVLSSEPHFHIYWISPNELDRERHDTREHAVESAKRLARQNEKYQILQFNKSCAQCQLLALAVGQ
jgi:hypothetical protein